MFVRLSVQHVSADPCPCHGKRERVQGAELFASTYYHLPNNLVEREPAEPPSSLVTLLHFSLLNKHPFFHSLMLDKVLNWCQFGKRRRARYYERYCYYLSFSQNPQQAAALQLEQREVAHMRYKHALARVHQEQVSMHTTMCVCVCVTC